LEFCLILAFSGSLLGMTARQYAFIARLLWAYQGRIALGVHQDTIGGDIEFDWICEQLGILRQARPSERPRAHIRARCDVEFCVKEEPRPFNLDEIVYKADLLIAAPRDTNRSGSEFSLVRRFEDERLPTLVVFPDGQYFLRVRNAWTGWWFEFAVPFGGPWPDLAYIEDPGSARTSFFEKRTFALLEVSGENIRVSKILGLFRGRPGEAAREMP
jgi:hypothetical protein